MAEPTALPRTGVTRALVVTAHPDDVDFGAAGTVAAWTDAGVGVSYCVCTSGDAGGFDDTPRDRMAALREAEQRAAAATRSPIRSCSPRRGSRRGRWPSCGSWPPRRSVRAT